MNNITQEKVNLIFAMEEQLNGILKDEPHKLWQETFIRKQIDRRNTGGVFTLTDHIRAMVYSMLSSGNQWADVAKNVDSATGCIADIDKIFYDYDVKKLKQASPDKLRKKIKEIHCGTQSTFNQMKALISTNIDVLCSSEEKYGTIDTYYQKFIDIDDSLKTLVIVPEFEAFDIVVALADKMKKPVAEVDYILWSYCAKGYGGICKKICI